METVLTVAFVAAATYLVCYSLWYVMSWGGGRRG